MDVRLARGLASALAMLVLTGAALAPAAAAEEPVITSQAQIANARFLAFAPPPEGGAGAVCLVDTGVDINPDTAANVIDRQAIDGGDPGDVYESKHGTRMAMLMGGAVNGWGSVGIWPHVRIVSVRAAPPGESGFPFAYYKHAVRRCRELARPHRINTINLSLGGGEATREEVERLRDEFAQANANGLGVVAAAGNGGGSVEHPAAIPEALAVGGSDPFGSLCRFSARGSGIDVVGPGCGLDVALPDGHPAVGSGTSMTSAQVAAVITALRSYQPTLTPADAEELLIETVDASRATIDVEAAFRAAGLEPVVESGNAAAPRGGMSQPRADRVSVVGPDFMPLVRPRLRSLRYRRGLLTLRLANRPRHSVTSVRLVYRSGRGEFVRRERTVEYVASGFRVRLPAGWLRVEIRHRSIEASPSTALVITRRRLGEHLRSNKRRAEP